MFLFANKCNRLFILLYYYCRRLLGVWNCLWYFVVVVVVFDQILKSVNGRHSKIKCDSLLFSVYFIFVFFLFNGSIFCVDCSVDLHPTPSIWIYVNWHRRKEDEKLQQMTFKIKVYKKTIHLTSMNQLSNQQYSIHWT